MYDHQTCMTFSVGKKGEKLISYRFGTTLVAYMCVNDDRIIIFGKLCLLIHVIII